MANGRETDDWEGPGACLAAAGDKAMPRGRAAKARSKRPSDGESSGTRARFLARLTGCRLSFCAGPACVRSPACRRPPQHAVVGAFFTTPPTRSTTHPPLLPSLLPSQQATFYGHQEGQDAQGTCSFSENYANTNGLPWTQGISTTIALNDAQFENGKGCGLCIMYRGTGSGIGTTPLATDR